MNQIPEGLRIHLNSELQYIQNCKEAPSDCKSTRNFEPTVVTKTSKKGKVKTFLRKHYPILGLLDKPSPSCALGVPPVLLPKLSFPRGRNQHRKLMNVVDFTSHVCNISFELKDANIEEKQLFVFKKPCILNPVLPEDQYDFFTSEIRKHPETGELIAFGDIPHTNGTRGQHPIRLPHLWMELFRRGFSFERPGPQGVDGPWILYNLEHLRFSNLLLFIYYFFCC